MSALDDANALCDDLVAELGALGWTLHDQLDNASPLVEGRSMLIAPGRTHMHAASFSAESKPWHVDCPVNEWADEAPAVAAAFRRIAVDADLVILPRARLVEGVVRLDFWTGRCITAPAADAPRHG